MVNRPFEDEFLAKMASGVKILETVTQPCAVERTSPTTFRIILTQGLNRQIRRMCEALGHRVIRLQRSRIMNVDLDMPMGEWRYLSEDEMKEIHARIALAGDDQAPGWVEPSESNIENHSDQPS
jgi:23S rRNA pseudouridine2604 synthase